MNYEQLIQNFLSIMANELSPNDFEIVKQNIRKISIKFLEKESMSTSGLYNPIGLITLHRKDEVTFYHELFHASSSYYDENKLVLNSGFHHQHINEKKDIGRGFNEGYTELLTQRYFGKNGDSGYSNELHYAKLIEHLIGKEQMQSFYFKSSLDDLITKMCKYNSLENVLKFIENMDKFIILTELKENKIHSFSENTPFTEYSKWFDELNEYVNQTYNELNQFIIESHLNKLYNDPDYEKKKAELMAMMSTPLSFNFREYSFNIDLQMSGNNRTI